MGVVVGFISEKGGVGKTTCCYHIAIGLTKFHKKRVLVIDTDYQRGGITCRLIPSMLEYFKKGEVPNKTLYNVFRALYADMKEDIKLDIVDGQYYNNISVLPSDPRLTEVSVDKLPGKRSITERNNLLYSHLSVINKAINEFKKEFDYILIDTHPEISDLLNSVIFACDYCVSPVKLDQQSSVGVPTTIEAINEVNKDGEYLMSMLETGSYKKTIFAGAIGMMTREYGEDLIYTMKVQYSKLKKTNNIFDNYISEGDGIRIAAERYLSVFDIDAGNAYKQSTEFKNVIKEFLKRCKQIED